MINYGFSRSISGACTVLLAAFTLCNMLTACSEKEDNHIDEVKVTVNEVTSGSDPAAQASRITYYTKSFAAPYSEARQDAGNCAELGSEPEIPSGLPSFNGEQEVIQSQEDKTHGYILTGGSGQIHLYGSAPVYITGDVETNNFQPENRYWDDVSDVYVMTGATLTIKDCNLSTGVRIHAFGALTPEGEGDVTISNMASIAAAGDLKFKGNLHIDGKFTCKELIVEKKLQVGGGACLKAKCIWAYGNGLSENDESINFGGSSEVHILSYLSTHNFYNQGGKVYFSSNAMASISNRCKMTSWAGEFTCDSSDPDAHALIRTSKFEVEGSSDDPTTVNQMFSGALKLVYEELTNMQPAFTEKFLPSADDYYIKEDGCNPGNGHSDTPTFDPEVHIDVPTGTHTHSHLSATCVQDVNGNAYVAYHLNEGYADVSDYTGTSVHQGCAEMIVVNDTKAEISSWMMNDNFDFNHLLVVGNTLYTVGDNKKGAALGRFNLEANGCFGQYELGEGGKMEVAKLADLGASANCIVDDGNSFRVAGTNGFMSLKSDLSGEGLISTTGVAKHIARHGNGFVTLNLGNKGVEASEATVTLYDPWGTAVNTFSVGTITPTDGKNVIASDGQYIYVCCGENGIKKFATDGTLAGEYNYITDKLSTKPDYSGKPCANGCAVDAKYVYVANGAAGVIVLDKNTMKRVYRYHHLYDANHSRGYSANYVQLVGERLFIAYGRDGLEVLHMRG